MVRGRIVKHSAWERKIVVSQSIQKLLPASGELRCPLTRPRAINSHKHRTMVGTLYSIHPLAHSVPHKDVNTNLSCNHAATSDGAMSFQSQTTDTGLRLTRVGQKGGWGQIDRTAMGQLHQLLDCPLGGEGSEHVRANEATALCFTLSSCAFIVGLFTRTLFSVTEDRCPIDSSRHPNAVCRLLQGIRPSRTLQWNRGEYLRPPSLHCSPTK